MTRFQFNLIYYLCETKASTQDHNDILILYLLKYILSSFNIQIKKSKITILLDRGLSDLDIHQKTADFWTTFRSVCEDV